MSEPEKQSEIEAIDDDKIAAQAVALKYNSITEEDLVKLADAGSLFLSPAFADKAYYQFKPQIEFLLLFANKVLEENCDLKEKVKELGLKVFRETFAAELLKQTIQQPHFRRAYI